MEKTEYRYEWLREFLVRRSWLAGHLVGPETYEGLKRRTTVAIGNDGYLRGFVDGWKSAKGNFQTTVIT